MIRKRAKLIQSRGLYLLFGALLLFIFIKTFSLLRREQLETSGSKKGSSDSTGTLFKGEIVRRMGTRLSLERGASKKKMKKTKVFRSKLKCRKWGVLTTINEPSEAVRRFGYDPSWCVVIVGDKGSSQKSYKLKSTLGTNILFLNDKDQEEIGSDFVGSLPWRSFGRKNVGYLFAIAHGADVIYDYDDDNMHKFWIPDSLPRTEFKTINDFKSYGDEYKTFKKNVKMAGCQVFNPYPYLGGPNGSWPRGFPLNCLRDSNTLYKGLITEKLKVSQKNPIGVLQSLAENEPDVDAIYRLTQKTPFNFKKHDIPGPGVILPSGIYSPYNAQATIHFTPGFWALYLPTSVSGRVSDILRSYVSKRLYDIFDIKMGFMTYPTVVQIRNSHAYLADFSAEIPLYTQVSVLLNYLDSYAPKDTSFPPEVILNLWIGLYERGYVEESDVRCMRKWLQTLLDIGYVFPNMKPPSQELKFTGALNFNVGTLVNTENFVQRNSCKTEGYRIWSPDYEIVENNLPIMDSFLFLSSLKQKVYPGPVKKELGPKSDVELSVIVQGKASNQPLSLKKLLQEYSVSQGLTESSDAMLCHTNLNSCLASKSSQRVGLILGTRYNDHICTEVEWKARLDQIKTFGDQNSGFLGVQHRFDAEYLRHFTDIDAPLIPPVGGQLSKEDIGKVNSANRKSVLYFGTVMEALQNIVKSAGLALESSMTKNDILAVIYVPNDVTSYELNLLYSRDIPVLSPSLQFLRDKGIFSSSKSTCKSLSSIPSYIQTWHTMDPGDESDQISKTYWWQLSDSFDLPHLIHFKDEEDLKRILKSLDFNAVRENMRKENAIRKASASEFWCNFVSGKK